LGSLVWGIEGEGRIRIRASSRHKDIILNLIGIPLVFF